MMQRMGMKVDEVSGVTQVVIRTPTRNIVIDGPSVASIMMQGQKMFQVVGGKISEQPAVSATPQPQSSPTTGVVTAQTSTAPSVMEIPQEDVNLVASQTGRSREDAQRALEASGGDLAKAILMLQSEKAQ